MRVQRQHEGGGPGLRRYWQSMTPEERSAEQSRRATKGWATYKARASVEEQAERQRRIREGIRRYWAARREGES